MDAIEQAAQLISEAEGLIITAGAGLGVDSGLPDFRGDDGFWRAYPALARAGIDFTSIANPKAFARNPSLAWGFYGHRLGLYRETQPHEGYGVLLAMANTMPRGAFVITSNVDGQFQKAGFDPNRIIEIHGSIHHMQCCQPCSERLWSAAQINPVTDADNCLWLGELPACPNCGALARPNILMFNDGSWIAQRRNLQEAKWTEWNEGASSAVVIECGAGVAIPSIRRISVERGCPVIRINPEAAEMPDGMGVSLKMGSRAALVLLRQALVERGFLPEKQTLA